MTTVKYRTTGTLTGTIDRENVGEAQAYLTEDDMAKYLDPPLEGVIAVLQWNLHADGHNYHIDAYALRELTDEELVLLSQECSGQNSDGLGESFEQQDFAWEEDECDEDDDCPGGCEGYGCESGRMIHFDWESNELPWSRIA